LSVDFGWWPRQSKNFGLVHYPMARVEVKHQNRDEWLPVHFLIDSGADITVMSKSDADDLDIDFEAGQRVSFGQATGDVLWARIHRVTLKFRDIEVPDVRVAFAERKIPTLLLGRLDITDFFDINLQGRAKRTTFAR